MFIIKCGNVIIVWWVFLQTFFLAFLFIVIEQQWNHPWFFQIWVMLCVIPYITNKSFNCSSIFNILIAYEFLLILCLLLLFLGFWCSHKVSQRFAWCLLQVPLISELISRVPKSFPNLFPIATKGNNIRNITKYLHQAHFSATMGDTIIY